MARCARLRRVRGAGDHEEAAAVGRSNCRTVDGLSRRPRLRMVPGARDCRVSRGGGSGHSDGGTRGSLPPCSGLPERVELGWNTTARHMAHHLSRRGGQPLCPGDWPALSHLGRCPCIRPGVPSRSHAYPRRPPGDAEIVGAASLGGSLVHRPYLQPRQQGLRRWKSRACG